MNPYLMLGLAVVAIVVAALVVAKARRRSDRRAASVHQLLELADKLEGDLKTCRAGLQQAHAVMSLNPDLPASSEQEARQAGWEPAGGRHR